MDDRRGGTTNLTGGHFSYEVLPASVMHIRPMARAMRAASVITVEGFGYNPREALRRIFVSSFYCRTAVMDGKPVAMWGVCGSILGDEATVWLVLSNAIQALPKAIVREARAELAKVAENYRVVNTTVVPDDEVALRFAIFLGFGERNGHSRRQTQAEIMADPENRIPIGDAYVLLLGYHPDEMRAN